MSGFGAAYGLLLSIFLGTGLGYGCDLTFGTSPWGLLLGALAGFAAGLYSLFRSLTPPS
ncbi:MAG: AtpZ/AtpI family protein [Candidatus Sericytochromatia bacterium]|nr:AtpZ/AtpI family protein [Candidatus Sericytochromatia bacterium]